MAGGVAERLKAVVLKTIVLQGTVGSNPTSSAILLRQDVFTLGFAGISGSSSKLREERSRLRHSASLIHFYG